MTLTKIDIKDETGYAKLAFFNQPHIKIYINVEILY